MARVKTNKVHYDKDGVIHEVSREKKTNKFFIKNTQIEVTGKTSTKKRYDYNKPFIAQDLGDEWDDYCWTADDF